MEESILIKSVVSISVPEATVQISSPSLNPALNILTLTNCCCLLVAEICHGLHMHGI
jgi:hypothetical protein